MTFFSALRERFQDRSTSSDSGDPNSDASNEPPYPGYERQGDREVISELKDHSQVELEQVEKYERSHKSRERVLDKLRYMRGREPLPGYDALSAQEIVAKLDGADRATLKRVRGYERKFANRPLVLDEVIRIQHASAEEDQHESAEEPGRSASWPT